MILRKLFLKLALLAGLMLSGLAGQASATAFSEGFENISDPNGASSFIFTQTGGVNFTASISSGALYLGSAGGNHFVEAGLAAGSITLTIARTDSLPWTFSSISIDNTFSSLPATLSANLAAGGTTSYPLLANTSGVRVQGAWGSL